jgi:tetratricopeptide (TPR) repeat protein
MAMPSRAAVAADRHDLVSRKYLAFAFLSVNDAGNCFRVHDEIAALAPDDPDSHFGYAAALATFGRYTDAAGFVRTALRLNPDDLPTLRLAALVFELSGHDHEAFAAFSRGAELGDRLLMFDLAMRYASGRGTDADPPVSLRWLERAAEGGHVMAMEMIRDIYRDGHGGIAPDAARAAFWAERARAAAASD